MPFVDIKSVVSSPGTDKLEQLANEIGRSLSISSKSRVRVVWSVVAPQDSAGMGEGRESSDLSQIVMLYCRADSSQKKIRAALTTIRDLVSEFTRCSADSVVGIYIPISPGALVTSNGFWVGQADFDP